MTSVTGNVVEQLCECDMGISTEDGAEAYCSVRDPCYNWGLET